MKIIGWLMSLAGIITSIIGIANREEAKSSYYGFGRYYNKSGIEDAELVLIIGLVIFVVGVLVLLVGYMRKNNSNVSKKINLLETKRCLNCGNIVNKNEKFCSKCGNNMIQ